MAYGPDSEAVGALWPLSIPTKTFLLQTEPLPKSAVAKPQERKFLGFSFTGGKELKRKIAPKAIDRFKERVREITHKARGRA